MNFSRRVNWDLGENEIAAAVKSRRTAGLELFDLTTSNPTRCDFEYPSAELLAPFADDRTLTYEPDPLGMHGARSAVATYYSDAGADVQPEHICLTSSTSEAYSYLFRLLCDPGDEVLVARPSYPLFDFIATLEDVQLREYALFYDPHEDASTGAGWKIDLHSLEASITPRTRAVVLVHPNNPTGQYASEEEQQALQGLCSKHRIALVVDEVFLDYTLFGSHVSFAAGGSGCLTFVVSGISKICALPQMKVSWIVARGPVAVLRQAMERLEMIADTYLSVSTPVQLALPSWLGLRHGIQQQIRRRMTANLLALDDRLHDTSAQRLAVQGGWTVILRVPRTVQGKSFALAAIDAGTLTQPGHFYGLSDGHIVLSLITPQQVWSSGLHRLPIDGVLA